MKQAWRHMRPKEGPSAQVQAEGLVDHYLPAMDGKDPKARKRWRILKAATEQFIRQGYRKTSMDEVARAAQVAKGTMYLYFPNKAELLAAALVAEKAQQASRLGGLLTQAPDGRDWLRRWLQGSLGALLDMPLTQRMLSGDREILTALEEIDHVLVRDTMAVQADAMAHLLQQALPKGGEGPAYQDVARVLMAIMYALPALLDARVRGPVPEDRMVHALVDVLVDGLAGATPGRKR